MLMAMMILSGLVALKLLNIQFFPSAEPTIVTVPTAWGGASTEDIESALTTPLEQRLRNVEDIRVVDTVLWNAEWGNAMEIGFELQTKKISGVLFKNCDIIHVERGGTFTIHNGDFARGENVRFENIRVEDSRDKLIELRVGLSIYSADCPWEYARKNPDRKRSPLGQWCEIGPDTEQEYADGRGHI